MVSLAAVLVTVDFDRVGRFVLRTGTSFEVGFLFMSERSIDACFVQCNKNFGVTVPAASGTRDIFITC